MTPEEYYTNHQQAFRCAFNFLNSHFPPGDDPEWWEKAANDMKTAADSQDNYPLAIGLLLGVWDYLYVEQKRRNQHEIVNA